LLAINDENSLIFLGLFRLLPCALLFFVPLFFGFDKRLGLFLSHLGRSAPERYPIGVRLILSYLFALFFFLDKKKLAAQAGSSLLNLLLNL